MVGLGSGFRPRSRIGSGTAFTSLWWIFSTATVGPPLPWTWPPLPWTWPRFSVHGSGSGPPIWSRPAAGSWPRPSTSWPSLPRPWPATAVAAGTTPGSAAATQIRWTILCNLNPEKNLLYNFQTYAKIQRHIKWKCINPNSIFLRGGGQLTPYI